jgi:hypothetical protein
MVSSLTLTLTLPEEYNAADDCRLYGFQCCVPKCRIWYILRIVRACHGTCIAPRQVRCLLMAPTLLQVVVMERRSLLWNDNRCMERRSLLWNDDCCSGTTIVVWSDDRCCGMTTVVVEQRSLLWSDDRCCGTTIVVMGRRPLL